MTTAAAASNLRRQPLRTPPAVARSAAAGRTLPTAASAPLPCASTRRARGSHVVAQVATGAGVASSSEPLLPAASAHWDAKKTRALMRLARIHNLLPSALLVLVGAWAGSGCSLAALAAPGVWLMALLSGGIAVSSCVFNDYIDLRVDMYNAPDKPLASGAVTTDLALLLSSGLYCTVLIVACFLVGRGGWGWVAAVFASVTSILHFSHQHQGAAERRCRLRAAHALVHC